MVNKILMLNLECLGVQSCQNADNVLVSAVSVNYVA